MKEALEQASREEGLRTDIKGLKKQIAEANTLFEARKAESEAKIAELEGTLDRLAAAHAETEAKFNHLAGLLEQYLKKKRE